MKSKTILVTGGAGFIGRHLVKRLVDAGHQLAVVDNLSVGQKTSLPAKVKFFRGQVEDPKLVNIFTRVRPEAVYHLGTDNRVVSPVKSTLNSNIIGTYNVLTAAKKARARQFIFTSSAAVFGDAKTFPITETHPTRPISPYGISKLTGEQYCQLFQSHFDTKILRFANVYGPGQSSTSEGGVVAIFISKLLAGEKPIIYGNGLQTRDFVFVADVVEALVLCLKVQQSFTLNIGTNQAVTIKQLLKLTAKLIDQRVAFIQKSARPEEIKKSLFEFKLANKTLGWRPQTSLADGLAQTIAAFKKK